MASSSTAWSSEVAADPLRVVAVDHTDASVAKALRRHADRCLTVGTGARNLPALRLYGQFGFAEVGRRAVGSEMLEVVRLRRPGATSP